MLKNNIRNVLKVKFFCSRCELRAFWREMVYSMDSFTYDIKRFSDTTVAVISTKDFESDTEIILKLAQKHHIGVRIEGIRNSIAGIPAIQVTLETLF